MGKIKNVLAVVAHPDDLEMMAGGTLLKWQEEGKKIHVLIFCNGTWYSPDGILMRETSKTEIELKNVSSVMKYATCDMLNEMNTHLTFRDELVCEVLNRISMYNIDTIITSWEKDTFHDHEVASRIAKAAGRRVANFFEGQINYYMNDFFTPNVYIDITKQWQNKISAMKLYTSQWERAGKDWEEFMDATSIYYGKVVGVKRAEGFITNKMTI